MGWGVGWDGGWFLHVFCIIVRGGSRIYYIFYYKATKTITTRQLKRLLQGSGGILITRCECKGTTLTTFRPPLSSGLLRRIYVFHYYHLIHVLTFIHFLLRPSPTFRDVAVHIPFLIPSLHIVPFPFSMIPHPSETCPTVS